MPKDGRADDKKAKEEKDPNKHENMNQGHNIRKQALGPNTKR